MFWIPDQFDIIKKKKVINKLNTFFLETVSILDILHLNFLEKSQKFNPIFIIFHRKRHFNKMQFFIMPSLTLSSDTPYLS